MIVVVDFGYLILLIYLSLGVPNTDCLSFNIILSLLNRKGFSMASTVAHASCKLKAAIYCMRPTKPTSPVLLIEISLVNQGIVMLLM